MKKKLKVLWTRRPRLGRGGKTVRNLLLALVLALLVWGQYGYPLPTAEMEFRRLERANLLPESEIIFNSVKDSPLQWRGSILSFSTQRVVIGLEGDRVHVAGLRYKILEVYPLSEGITPIPLYNLFVREVGLGSSDSGVPLLFLNVPAEAGRANVEIDAVGRSGEALRGRGEGWCLAPGKWMFSVAPGDDFSGEWYADGTYTLRLYRADGSLLLEQSGRVGQE